MTKLEEQEERAVIKKIEELATRVVDELEPRLSGLKPCNKQEWCFRAALLVYYAETFAEQIGTPFELVLSIKNDMKKAGLLEAETKSMIYAINDKCGKCGKPNCCCNKI